MPAKISIPTDDIDETSGSCRLDLLALPHSSVASVYVNEKKLASREYRVKGTSIAFGKARPVKKSDTVTVYLDVKSRRINTERNTAIIVAVIGLVGTVLSVVLQPDWLRAPEMRELITFEADTWGVDLQKGTFETVMRWEPPSEKNHTFDETTATENDAWAFVRIRKNLVDPREAKIQDILGPLALRNGMKIESKIAQSMLQDYQTDQSNWLQMIVIAVPKGQRVADGQKVSDLGANAKVILTASYRPPRCP